MWSHYADDHKGVMFQLNCIKGLERSLCHAEKVDYIRDFPSFISLNNWASHLLGLKVIDFKALAMSLAFLKHRDWKSEEEWRIHIPLPMARGRDASYSYYSFQKEELEAIYFGCNIDTDVKRKLSELVKEKYPHMFLYETQKGTTSFTLNYTKMSNSS